MPTKPKRPLRRRDLQPDPVDQFRDWLQQTDLDPATALVAMSLATADNRGRPSVRTVLLRGFDPRGLVFFTSYQSRKGRELDGNPHAALLFYWPQSGRQVRVEGSVEKLTDEESDAYFAARPRGHQLQAHASPQSRVIADRTELVQRFEEADAAFAGRSVPRPSSWGGYRARPDLFEFWQEGFDRLHDRLCYRLREDGTWLIERLAP